MGRNRYLKTMSKKDNIQKKATVSPSRPLICSTAFSIDYHNLTSEQRNALEAFFSWASDRQSFGFRASAQKDISSVRE